MIRKWTPTGLILVAVVLSIVMYPRLSDPMPTHWGIAGEVNGWSSRLWGAWMLPLMMSAILLLMRALPHIDPRKANYARFAGMYDTLVILIIAFMLVIHIVVLLAASGTPVAMNSVMMPSVGVFMVAMGILLPRAKPNWFVGIRTPWTLTSDLAWERTHKIAGLLFIMLGLLVAGSSFIAPERAIRLLVVVAIGVVLFLFVYSYLVWRGDPSKW